MSIQKKELNKVGGGAGGRILISKVRFGVIELAHPSVERFKTSKMPFCLDVKGPPLGISTIDIVAQSMAPKCNYGHFKHEGPGEIIEGKLQLEVKN